METLLMSLALASVVAPLQHETPNMHNPDILIEKGFEAFVLCEKDGKLYDPRQNHVVRENGVLKIVRICRPEQKKSRLPCGSGIS